MRAILVTWEDARAVSLEPWTAIQPYTWEPCIVHTVGFVLYEGPEGYILTDSYNDAETGPVQQIPAGMVREVKEL